MDLKQPKKQIKKHQELMEQYMRLRRVTSTKLCGKQK